MNPLEARRRLLGRKVYKRTTEGNPAIAQGSLARMHPGITMQGWTEQDSTTGAQLFDIASATIGAVSRITGENLEYGVNWKRSDYIQVVSGQQYSCTYVANYQDTGFAFYDEQKAFLSGIPCTTNFTVPESAVFCRITVNTTDGDPNIFMFNAGSTALPYEPYTGGQPSPSPDYPQEIVSAGNWNEETQKWEYEITITNAQTDPDKNQTATLTADRPLTKWDKLEKRNGQWGWVYKSGVKQLISDANIFKNEAGTYQVAIFAKADINRRTESLSTHFIYKLSETEYGNFWFDGTGTGLRFRMSQLQTAEEVKGWLQENEVYFAFPNAEETFVPLSPEEQEAMNALYTYRPTTVLSNQQGCQMTLTYKTRKGVGGVIS